MNENEDHMFVLTTWQCPSRTAHSIGDLSPRGYCSVFNRTTMSSEKRYLYRVALWL